MSDKDINDGYGRRRVTEIYLDKVVEGDSLRLNLKDDNNEEITLEALSPLNTSVDKSTIDPLTGKVINEEGKLKGLPKLEPLELLTPIEGTLTPNLLAPLEDIQLLVELEHEDKADKSRDELESSGLIELLQPININDTLTELVAFEDSGELMPLLEPILEPIEIEEEKEVSEGYLRMYIEKEEDRIETLDSYRTKLIPLSSSAGNRIHSKVLSNIDQSINQYLPQDIRESFATIQFFEYTKDVSKTGNYNAKESEEIVKEFFNVTMEEEFEKPLEQYVNSLSQYLSDGGQVTDPEYIQNYNDYRRLFNTQQNMKQHGLESYLAVYQGVFLKAHREVEFEENNLNQRDRVNTATTVKLREESIQNLNTLKNAERVSLTRHLIKELGTRDITENSVTVTKSANRNLFECGYCKENSVAKSSFMWLNEYPLATLTKQDAPSVLLTLNHHECEHCKTMNILPQEAVRALEEYSQMVYENKLKEQRRSTRKGTEVQLNRTEISTQILTQLLDKHVKITVESLGTIIENRDSFSPHKFITNYGDVRDNWLNKMETLKTSNLITKDSELRKVAEVQYLLSANETKLYRPGIGNKLHNIVIGLVMRTVPYKILKQLRFNIKKLNLDIIALKKYKRFITEQIAGSSDSFKLLDTTEKYILDFQRRVSMSTGVLAKPMFEKFDLTDLRIRTENVYAILNSIDQRTSEINQTIYEETDVLNTYLTELFNPDNYKNIEYVDVNVTETQVTEFYKLGESKEQVLGFINSLIDNLTHNSAVTSLMTELEYKKNLTKAMRSNASNNGTPYQLLQKLELIDSTKREFLEHRSERQLSSKQVYTVLQELRRKDYFGIVEALKESTLNQDRDTGKELVSEEDFNLIQKYKDRFGDYARIIMHLEGLGWDEEELYAQLQDLGEYTKIPFQENYPKRRGKESLSEWFKDILTGSYNEPLVKKKYENKILKVYASLIYLEDIYRELLKTNSSDTTIQDLVEVAFRNYVRHNKSFGLDKLNIDIKDIAQNYNSNKEFLDVNVEALDVENGLTFDDVLIHTPTMSKVEQTSFVRNKTVKELLTVVASSINDPNDSVPYKDMEDIRAFLQYSINEIDVEWLDSKDAYEMATELIDMLEKYDR